MSRQPVQQRYFVAVWHGEGGSIAQVIDRQNDDVLGYYSTIRDGKDWKAGADRQAAALNRSLVTGIGRERNPGALVAYGNPGRRRNQDSAGVGSTLTVKLTGTLGFIEKLTYERTRQPKGGYYHDFGFADALWMGELSDGQRVIIIANVNGKPLWGTA